MKQKIVKHGVLDLGYAKRRETNRALKYRLWRRTFEVIESIKKFSKKDPNSIIDLGTADGKMLSEIKKSYPHSKCVGIEYNNDLVKYANSCFPHLEIKQGDVQNLQIFKNEQFDVAIATAVIEHVINPQIFINEIKRLLKPSGILIITAPDPLWEFIATKVGLLDDEQHNEVPNIKRIKELVINSEMTILFSKKFMISPIGMPGEFIIENFLRKVGLNFMMANQLVISQK